MAASRPRPLVLVPGACLGGWAWQQVARELRSHGHDVYPLTLTGLGERAHLGGPSVDLETHIEDVVGVLDFERLEDVILVGHSYACVVVTAVADRRPQRLNAVVYLDTGPLADGQAIVDFAPPEGRERQRSEVLAGDGWSWPVPSREVLETGAYGSPSGLGDADFAAIAERGTPHPYATFTSRLSLEHAPDPAVRRAAIFCTDGGVEIAMIERLIEQGDPRGLAFADPGWELRELATGHWSMFSRPLELATLLRELAGP
jgi:pimeloyl-ACP methyl ester carboxylesterase